MNRILKWAPAVITGMIAIVGLWAILNPPNPKGDIEIFQDVNFSSKVANKFFIKTNSSFTSVIIKVDNVGIVSLDWGLLEVAPEDLYLNIEARNKPTKSFLINKKGEVLRKEIDLSFDMPHGKELTVSKSPLDPNFAPTGTTTGLGRR